MSGICDTCHRDQCNLRMDGLKMCDLHEGGETRYEQLFGTPERAARTLAGISCNGDCYSCSLYGAHCTCDGASQLEWLRGEGE